METYARVTVAVATRQVNSKRLFSIVDHFLAMVRVVIEPRCNASLESVFICANGAEVSLEQFGMRCETFVGASDWYRLAHVLFKS